MTGGNVIKSYLVALGMRDVLSGPMARTLNQNARKIRQFSRGVASAGIAVAGMLVAANAGIVRLATNLVRTDDEISRFAEEMGKSREEAERTHFALNAMGRSLEEIEASPELAKQFQQLQRDAAAVQLPDMSQGLNQVRAIQGEFLRFRQAGSYAIQWIGHHLLKYLYHPMNRLREVFSGLNDRIIGGMPEWTKRIASVMASVVNMTVSIIRGAAAIFRAIRRIFDMIPTEIKILMGVLAAFAAFIRAGPIGKLMMLFTVLMLLVEDFFTYLDGGEALLGGLWGWLINLWNTINEGGGFVERLKAAFTAAMDAAVRAIRWAIDWVARLWQRLRDIGALENFREAFSRVGAAISDVFNALRSVFSTLLSGFQDGAETVQPFLAWLIGVALPGAIGLIADVVSFVANAVSAFMELSFARELLIGIAVAIGSVVAAFKIYKGIMAIVTAVKAAYAAVLTVAATAKAILLSPITLIIAAIGALIAIVVLVKRNWESIVDFFRNLWERVLGFFTGLWDRITGVFRRAIDAVVGFFRGIIDWIKDNFAAIVLFILNPFAGIFKFLYDNFEGFRNFVDNIVSAIRNFFTNLWTRVRDGARAFIAAIVGFFTNLRDRIQATLRTLIDFILGIWNRIKSGVSAFVTAVVGFFTGLWDRITGVFSAVGSFFANAFNMAWEGIQNAFSAVGSFFQGIWDRIVSIFTTIGTAVGDAIGGAFRNVVNTIISFAESTINGFIRAINAAIRVINAIPGVNITLLNPLEIPRLERGSENTPDTFIAGDVNGKGGELITGAKGRKVFTAAQTGDVFKTLREIAGLSGGGAARGEGRSYTVEMLSKISQGVESVVHTLSEIASLLGAIDKGLNQGINHYHASNVVNHYTYNNDLTSSYNINDTSGKPQSVAYAVDRTKQIQLRNLQGILNTY